MSIFFTESPKKSKQLRNTATAKKGGVGAYIKK
jgi:hypothetical protein